MGKKNDTVTLGNSTTQLGQGFGEAAQSGVGISPGAKPQFDKPTPLEQLGGIARSVARGVMNITGSFRSPSTQRDVGHGMTSPVRPDKAVEAAYQADLAARKKRAAQK